MTQISLAPLQGYTDYVFRNALNKHMGGIDKFYSPYLRLQNDQTLKRSQITDILPENNVLNLIPQILCNTSEAFQWFDNYLSDMGYTEMNWNLGCPYPMVAKRKLGSGLLPFPELIDSILSDCRSNTKLKVSIKLRLGYENPDEINGILNLLEQYPIEEIILHPRIGKDIYKNDANKNAFATCNNITKYKLAYNGDLIHLNDANTVLENNPSVEHLMIGRGLLKNPFLANEIKSGQPLDEERKRDTFLQFYMDLHQHYQKSLSGDSHQVNKLLHLWEYFSHLFIQKKKVYKRLKKIKHTDRFLNESMAIIQNEGFFQSESTQNI